MTDEDNIRPDHYFRDSGGDMWVNVSAVRRSNAFELLTVDPNAEITLDTTDARVGTRYPSLQMVLSTEGQEALEEHMEHTDD